MQVNAYVIYNGTMNQYVGDNPPIIQINCERLQAFSPRPVWLKRFLAPGDGTIILYEPTFSPNSLELLDSNTLQGFWIEQDGQDVMIDAESATAFLTACDACCGAVPFVTRFYVAGIPLFAPPTVNSICIYSFDDGSAGAHDNFADRYVGNYIGKVVLRSSFSNVSHYTLTTYHTITTFPLQMGDVIYAGACGS